MLLVWLVQDVYQGDLWICWQIQRLELRIKVRRREGIGEGENVMLDGRNICDQVIVSVGCLSWLDTVVVELPDISQQKRFLGNLLS